MVPRSTNLPLLNIPLHKNVFGTLHKTVISKELKIENCKFGACSPQLMSKPTPPVTKPGFIKVLSLNIHVTIQANYFFYKTGWFEEIICKTVWLPLFRLFQSFLNVNLRKDNSLLIILGLWEGIFGMKQIFTQNKTFH